MKCKQPFRSKKTWFSQFCVEELVWPAQRPELNASTNPNTDCEPSPNAKCQRPAVLTLLGLSGEKTDQREKNKLFCPAEEANFVFGCHLEESKPINLETPQAPKSNSCALGVRIFYHPSSPLTAPVTSSVPGVVSHRLRIHKYDVIAGGRGLRPGTMASVGTEVSV